MNNDQIDPTHEIIDAALLLCDMLNKHAGYMGGRPLALGVNSEMYSNLVRLADPRNANGISYGIIGHRGQERAEMSIGPLTIVEMPSKPSAVEILSRAPENRNS